MLRREDLPELDELRRSCKAVRARISELKDRLVSASDEERLRIETELVAARKDLDSIGRDFELVLDYKPMFEEFASASIGSTSEQS